jgi:hypothetical protein
MVAAPSWDLDALAADVAAVMLDTPSFGALVEIPAVPTRDERAKGILGKVAFGWEQWHPEQRRFERERTGRDLVLKPRQIGFSTMELLRDLQFARTHEGVQVVVVVHTGEAKNELFARVHTMVRCLQRWGLVPDAKENTKTGLRWSDIDSSIKIIEAGKDEGTAAARGRSGTIHRLHVTECAFYQSPEETMTALLAASEDAEVVIESTANGISNWFHERVMLCREGKFEDFRFHFFPWFEHPNRRLKPGSYPAPATKREQLWEQKLHALGCDIGQIAWWRRTVQKYGLDKALREYPPTPDAAFTVSTTKWFAPEHIDRLRASVVDPIERVMLKRGETEYGELRVYKRPVAGTAYILAADPSGGMGNNAAALTIIEHRSGDVCACWDNNRVKPGEFGHVIAIAGRMYHMALAAPERNEWRDRDGNDKEGGLETLDILERVERYPRIYRDAKTKKAGWSMNGHTRPLVFGDLQKGIEDAEEPLTTPDARTVDEAASLVLAPKTNHPYVPGKKHGRGDDGLFITWGIARQVRARSPMPGKVIARNGPPLTSSGFMT